MSDEAKGGRSSRPFEFNQEEGAGEEKSSSLAELVDELNLARLGDLLSEAFPDSDEQVSAIKEVVRKKELHNFINRDPFRELLDPENVRASLDKIIDVLAQAHKEGLLDAESLYDFWTLANYTGDMTRQTFIKLMSQNLGKDFELPIPSQQAQEEQSVENSERARLAQFGELLRDEFSLSEKQLEDILTAVEADYVNSSENISLFRQAFRLDQSDRNVDQMIEVLAKAFDQELLTGLEVGRFWYYSNYYGDNNPDLLWERISQINEKVEDPHLVNTQPTKVSSDEEERSEISSPTEYQFKTLDILALQRSLSSRYKDISQIENATSLRGLLKGNYAEEYVQQLSELFELRNDLSDVGVFIYSFLDAWVKSDRESSIELEDIERIVVALVKPLGLGAEVQKLFDQGVFVEIVSLENDLALGNDLEFTGWLGGIDKLRPLEFALVHYVLFEAIGTKNYSKFKEIIEAIETKFQVTPWGQKYTEFVSTEARKWKQAQIEEDQIEDETPLHELEDSDWKFETPETNAEEERASLLEAILRRRFPSITGKIDRVKILLNDEFTQDDVTIVLEALGIRSLNNTKISSLIFSFIEAAADRHFDRNEVINIITKFSELAGFGETVKRLVGLGVISQLTKILDGKFVDHVINPEEKIEPEEGLLITELLEKAAIGAVGEEGTQDNFERLFADVKQATKNGKKEEENFVPEERDAPPVQSVEVDENIKGVIEVRNELLVELRQLIAKFVAEILQSKEHNEDWFADYQPMDSEENNALEIGRILVTKPEDLVNRDIELLFLFNRRRSSLGERYMRTLFKIGDTVDHPSRQQAQQLLKKINQQSHE